MSDTPETDQASRECLAFEHHHGYPAGHLQAEHKPTRRHRLANFAQALLDDMGEGMGDVDYDRFFEIAEEYGVAKQVPFNPELHENIEGAEYLVPGEDLIWVWGEELMENE